MGDAGFLVPQGEAVHERPKNLPWSEADRLGRLA